ncbi:MAG: hypothetical protein ISR65_14800 [Bacteriovoracaceae bacterium]|nr:hypothetical protein [Bacteriovoracaceae bacterium]
MIKLISSIALVTGYLVIAGAASQTRFNHKLCDGQEMMVIPRVQSQQNRDATLELGPSKRCVAFEREFYLGDKIVCKDRDGNKHTWVCR